jgi:hypothetical protein
MSINPDRDPDDPLAHLNALETALLAARLPPCPHCTVKTEMLAMGRNGYAVGVAHEPGCPEHEDSQPTNEVDISDLDTYPRWQPGQHDDAS